MRLFLYEYACAQPATANIPDSVRREGRAMFEAIVEDAYKLRPEIDIIMLSYSEHSDFDSQVSFRATARKSDYALIIAPEFDNILENHARWALEEGCQLLGPHPHAIRLTSDKWSMYQHWSKQLVPTPVTWLPPKLPTQHDLYLQKHRYGAGSLGVGYWQLGDKLPKQHLVQQFIPGQSVSLAVLVSPNLTLQPLLPARQDISNDGHFTYLGGSFLNDHNQVKRVINLATSAIRGIPGLQGYIGIDAILGNDPVGNQDHVIEINPRLTTSYLGLRQATESNLIQSMLDVVLCDKVVPINWKNSNVQWSS